MCERDEYSTGIIIRTYQYYTQYDSQFTQEHFKTQYSEQCNGYTNDEWVNHKMASIIYPWTGIEMVTGLITIII